MSSLSILSTSQTSILGFRSTYILTAMTKYCVWYYLGKVGFGSNERNPSLLVRDDARMKMCGKALGVSWWMQSLGKSRGRNPLGLWPLRFCPWHFPRDSIRHGTPLAFPHIVPGVWSVNNRATNQRLWQNISILLSPLVKVYKFYLDKSKQKFFSYWMASLSPSHIEWSFVKISSKHFHFYTVSV